MTKLEKLIEDFRSESEGKQRDISKIITLFDAFVEKLIVELGKLKSNCGIKIFGGEIRAYVLMAYKAMKEEE